MILTDGVDEGLTVNDADGFNVVIVSDGGGEGLSVGDEVGPIVVVAEVGISEDIAVGATVGFIVVVAEGTIVGTVEDGVVGMEDGLVEFSYTFATKLSIMLGARVGVRVSGAVGPLEAIVKLVASVPSVETSTHPPQKLLIPVRT